MPQADITQAFTAELFAAFPEWRQFSRTERAADGAEYLVVEVEPPATADVEDGLTIDTADGEITVGFDVYHCHFDAWVGDGEHVGAAAALAFIRQIVTEQIGIASWWQGQEWKGSNHVAAGMQPERSWPGTFDRVRIRSWSGRLNADISA